MCTIPYLVSMTRPRKRIEDYREGSFYQITLTKCRCLMGCTSRTYDSVPKNVKPSIENINILYRSPLSCPSIFRRGRCQTWGFFDALQVLIGERAIDGQYREYVPRVQCETNYVVVGQSNIRCDPTKTISAVFVFGRSRSTQVCIEH